MKLNSFFASLLISIAAVASSDEATAASISYNEELSREWLDFPLTFMSFKNFQGNPFYSVPDSASMTLSSLEADIKTPRPTYFEDDSTPMLRLTDRIRYDYIINHPGRVRYVYSLLPDPPELTDRKESPAENIIADLPEFILEEEAPKAFDVIRQTNWLHSFNGALQFSQAYLSPNWYQGGNNALTLLVNFFWNVKLNEVYHPNLMLDNTISYKLALNSTPQDTYHKYSVSEDIFQWNFLFGVKAWHKWFYSFTTQFKTQFLNTYGENSPVRKAAFLSPGSLTLGLGMTYSTTNKAKGLKFNASISPLSYNLNTCIDKNIDPTQYNIPLGRKTKSEIGSNAELTLDWNITSNILWRSRLFTFTNYDYFLGDWENTFSFTINRFLSTQIYVHLRYDSSTDVSALNSRHWRYWMLKEMLSFGFSYTFSTK